MRKQCKILYCHCAHAGVVGDDVRQDVLKGLCGSGIAFDAVADLCELSARHDESLKRVAESGPVAIAACHRRAVRSLFAAAGAPLADGSVTVLNMRSMSAEQVLTALARAASSPEGRP